MEELFFIILVIAVLLTGAPLAIWSFVRTVGLKARVAELEKKVYQQALALKVLEDRPAVDVPPVSDKSATMSQDVANEAVYSDAPDDESAAAVNDNEMSEDGDDPVVESDENTSDSEGDAPAASDGPTLEEQPLPEPIPPIAAAKRAADAESNIGGKISVWVGGVTMALGAVFLVRYAVEAGLLGPTARIALGVLFGFGLCGLGEFLRRRDGAKPLVEGYAWANIPAILTAIGTFAIFAALYAAHALYDLFGPTTAFVILGAVALFTMAAALLHGAALAAIGLLGSLIMPFLLSTGKAQILPVAIYVLIVAASAISLARLRKWLWLAIAGTVGLFIYAMLFELAATQTDYFTVLAFLLAAIGLVVVTFVTSLYSMDRTQTQPLDWTATIAIAAFALPFLSHQQFGDFPVLIAFKLVFLFGGTFLLAAYYPAVRFVVFFPALIALGRFLQWDALNLGFAGMENLAELRADQLFLNEKAVTAFTLTGIVLVVGGFFAGVWGSLKSVSRAQLSAVSVFFVLGVFVILYGRLEGFRSSFIFALLASGLFVAFRAYGELIAKRLTADETGRDAALASWLIGSLVALGLAVAMFLEDAALTVVLGLLVPAFAFTYRQHPLPILKALTPLSIVPFGIRLLQDPFIDADALSTTPVLNVLTYGYGIPALGVCLAAYLLWPTKQDIWNRATQSIAISGVAVTLTMVILHVIQPSFRFDQDGNGLLWVGAVVLVGGGVSLGLLRLAAITKDGFFGHFSSVLALAGIIPGGAGLFFFVNPALFEIPISKSILFNEINFSYFLSFLLYALTTWKSRGVREPAIVYVTGIFSALLFALWVNLTIRHFFVDDPIWRAPVGDLENYTYSVVWLAIGIAVLAFGLWTGSRLFRAVSGVVIAAVIVKVFLVDMSALTGILRAMSFIGLGGVLMGIGYFYQRLLLQKPNEPAVDN